MSPISKDTYQDWRDEQLKDPDFRAAYDALEPGYQIARLRILRGLTQAELAKRVGTRQPSIARLESGSSEPSLRFLKKVVEVLGGELEISIKEKPGARVFVTENR